MTRSRFILSFLVPLTASILFFLSSCKVNLQNRGQNTEKKRPREETSISTIPSTINSTVGYINGVFKEGDEYYIQGWVCHREIYQSLGAVDVLI